MTAAAELLVDRRTGIISALNRDAAADGAPASYTGYTARLAATDRFAAWRADPVAHGAALDDDDLARAAAVGEAVERYCGNAVPAGLRTATHRELADAGTPALDPGTLGLFSPAQYADPGFPFVPFTRDIPVEWVPGRWMGSGEPVLVPATLTYLNHHRAGRAATNPQIYAGIATGTDREHAEHSALLELVERDALTIWWLGGGATVHVDGHRDGRIATWLAEIEHAGRHCHLLHIPSTFALPVIGAFLHDPGRDLVALGAACRPDAGAAAHKAIVEAVDTLVGAAEMLGPDAAVWALAGTGSAYGHPYRPYREDRAYRQSFRPDLRDVTDLASHTQLYLDPAAQAAVIGRMTSPTERVPLGALPRGPATTGGILALLAAAGLRAASVDLTTPDVRAAGLHVARVVIAGLASYMPAAFPLLGCRRLFEVPAELGWAGRALTEDDLVREPLPYA